MFNPTYFRFLPSAFVSIAFCLGVATADAVTVAQPAAIGLEHAQTKPYNFCGDTFTFSNEGGGFGSATAIRRHTALTAAHVVFEPVIGFLTRQAFNRGRYEDYTFQRFPVAAVAVLSGYTTLVSGGADFFDTSERDLGYMLYTIPPKDEDWADTVPTGLVDQFGQPEGSPLLDAPNGVDGNFVLGYPAISFDGATQAYVVPDQAFIDLGNGELENDGYLAEPGMSGGPIFAVQSTGTDASGNTTFSRQVAAETVGGGEEQAVSGEATQTIAVVREVDAEAAQFLASAEYANGLIKKVQVLGPTTVNKGTTVTYNAHVKFQVPRTDGGSPARPITDRYREIQLVTNTPGTATNPAVSITKLSNSQFQVTFSPTLRSRSQITLTADYAPNTPAPRATITVTIN